MHAQRSGGRLCLCYITTQAAAADGDDVRREALQPLTWSTADAHMHVRVERWLLGSKVEDSRGGDDRLRIRSDGLMPPPLPHRVKGRQRMS